MAIFLDWFASHNTLVIQSLAGIVALLIVFLIFRLLFASNPEAAAAKNVTYAALEEKLNKLLEQQAQMKASVNAATDVQAGEVLSDDALAALSGDPSGVAAAAAAAVGATAIPSAGDQAAELSRLRAEISTLKDSVKRKENEIIDAKEQAQKSINTAQQETKLNDLSGKLTDYENEIDALKGRLSDYEIIAEDIADLQAFKKENQELKNQLANAAPVSTSVQATMESVQTDSEPTVDVSAEELMADLEAPKEEPQPTTPAPQKKTEIIAAPEPEVVSEPVSEPAPEPAPQPVAEESSAEASLDQPEEDLPADFFAAANDLMDESIPDSEPEVESMPEASASRDLDNDEAREVSKDVKKEDKILLDEFEKHFAKDED